MRPTANPRDFPGCSGSTHTNSIVPALPGGVVFGIHPAGESLDAEVAADAARHPYLGWPAHVGLPEGNGDKSELSC